MDEDAVRDRLRTVDDPELGDDIVSLGLVNDISVDDDTVEVDLALGAPYSPTESDMAAEIRQVLVDEGLEPELSASIPDRDDLASEDQVLPNVKNVIAVSSGKGGVGKSTLSVNLAAGLSQLGARVGLFDADVYGPNVPRMVDADEPPMTTEEETLVPPEKYGVKLMSMAFLTGEDDPVIWRGPMVHKVITQLTEDVEWGHLDYLIIDLPPGTGDTQLTMLQTMPVTGSVIVTTPQDVALDDARKGLEMFAKHDTVVLGIAENMSTFSCPDCGGEHDIFGSGGGEEFAETHEMPFLGSVPLDPAVREGGDGGKPTVLEDDSSTGDAFRTITENVANNTGIVHRRGISQSRQSGAVTPDR
ncbi:Mrp/NBP35 family ATP-binding protein [Natronorubrum daqingense]|uniref:Iron-sulfur cluster carrier protein n=1 Tax=Natronorubrum daqingense TaxID=588898 RepID=A0A1N6XX14_9EURY|nr:Mrp/NBP35 family ATP-binding protein [Natronorubrum daqingense]APX95843.1 MRP family ATP-binding protein [Natronorubrum daqingense]SIR06771.1 ATP-binding protein involved in chromosome partitioning [Natronorubrum daqingense]